MDNIEANGGQFGALGRLPRWSYGFSEKNPFAVQVVQVLGLCEVRSRSKCDAYRFQLPAVQVEIGELFGFHRENLQLFQVQLTKHPADSLFTREGKE